MSEAYRIYDDFQLTLTQIRYLLQAYMVGDPSDLPFEVIWEHVMAGLDTPPTMPGTEPMPRKKQSINQYFWDTIRSISKHTRWRPQI